MSHNESNKSITVLLIVKNLTKLIDKERVKMLKKLGLLAIVFLVGCTSAKKSSEVQAVRVPISPYLKMSCPELVTEQQTLFRELEASGVAVDKQYQSEKNTELVTWILFAPAAFWMKGNETEASRFAAQKGQMEAINEALKINKCGIQAKVSD